MSPDGKFVAFAEVEDVTSDPFKAVAEKIKVDGEPMKGKKDAKVTIVEYSDFQCPYCARAHATIEDQVMKQYGDKVRLLYKHFPLGFHKWAEPAAVATECAAEQDQDAYWKLYDFYFKNQQQITPENLRDKTLETLAGTKVDQAKFTDCYDNKKTLEQVKAEMAEGQEVGVTGTPAFIINGRKLSGAQPFERFKDIIDDELQRAGS
jgi:protein-disulfide isomerase